MRKDLVIVADSDPRCRIVGGVGMYASLLAKELSLSHEVLYVGKRQVVDASVEVPYEVSVVGKGGGSNISFLFSLFGFARKVSYDEATVLHAQRPDWLFPFRKSSAFKVVTLHGSHAKNMLLKKGSLLTSLYLWFEKRGLLVADHVIAVDSRTQKEFLAKYPFLKGKISVLPVGVDTKLFVQGNKRVLRKKLGLPVAAKIFLYVGRFSKEKNIDKMIEAVDEHQTLVLVGSGEEESRLRELAVGKNVVFAGPKGHEELPLWYACADAFLLLSSHEGLPTVVLEALSCGVPVVCTKVGELPSLIRNGENGYLVGKDPRKAMRDVLKNNEVMKRSCRKTALSYDWKEVAKRIDKEVYQQ